MSSNLGESGDHGSVATGFSCITEAVLSEALLSSDADAIIAADFDGIIRFWNPGAVRIFGYARTEALGQSLDIVIHERLRARHWAGYPTGESRYGRGDVLAVPGMRKDGSRVCFAGVHDNAAEGRGGSHA
jgi:PAS domain S-box-containing protein